MNLFIKVTYFLYNALALPFISLSFPILCNAFSLVHSCCNQVCVCDPCLSVSGAGEVAQLVEKMARGQLGAAAWSSREEQGQSSESEDMEELFYRFTGHSATTASTAPSHGSPTLESLFRSFAGETQPRHNERVQNLYRLSLVMYFF